MGFLDFFKSKPKEVGPPKKYKVGKGLITIITGDGTKYKIGIEGNLGIYMRRRRFLYSAECLYLSRFVNTTAQFVKVDDITHVPICNIKSMTYQTTDPDYSVEVTT